jgi:hypothetical protein
MKHRLDLAGWQFRVVFPIYWCREVPEIPHILVGSEAIALWRSGSSFVMHRFYLAVTIVGTATLVVVSLVALERMIG